MQQPSALHVAPARHARLFELLRQQEQARAVAARLVARTETHQATITPLARINAQSLHATPLVW